MEQTLYWVWLVMAFGAANPRIWELLNECGSVNEAYEKLQRNEVPLTRSMADGVACTSLESAAELVRKCEKEDIRILTFDDKGYPSNLRSIYNPPAVLFVKGSIDDFNTELIITVVGTRNPSPYGLKAVSSVSGELSSSGFIILSGFAAGIDSAAHRAAIQRGGKTIAVLGCGIDVDYPKANSDIREAVIKNGAVISEFLPGTPPLGKNFPVRNRILSGMSLGVFVAEAPIGSGALITADMAVEQGRDVFCIPPADIFDPKYQGVVKYLRDGAVPVFSHLDIIYEYYTTFSHKLSSMKPENEFDDPVSEGSVFAEKKNIKKKSSPVHAEKTEPVCVKISYDGLSDDQICIVKSLESGQSYIDDICESTGLDITDILAEITELEMTGKVVSLPGKQYKLR